MANTRKRLREVSKPITAQSWEAPTLSKRDVPEIEEVLLFKVQDDDDPKNDREFWIPKEVSRSTTAKLLEIQATQGESAAIIWMMREVMGDKAWEYLRDAGPDMIDDDTFDSIVNAVTDIVLGPGKFGARG
jgi:hypothetical protein